MRKLTVKFCTVLTLEVLAFVVAIIFVAWLSLLWRLSQGPLNVDFLTEPLEKTLSGIHANIGINIDLGTTELVWGGSYRDPLELHLKDVQVSRSDKTPLLVVTKIGLEMAPQSLLLGKMVPRSVTFYGLALRIVRDEQGHFVFNVMKDAVVPGPVVEEAAPPGDTGNMISQFLMMLDVSEEQTDSAIGALRRFSIADSVVLYEDKKLGGQWKTSDVNVVLARGRTGLTGNATMDLETGDKKAALQVNVYRDGGTHNSHVIALFEGLNPKLVAGSTPALEKLAGFDITLGGSVEVKFDGDLAPVDGRLFFRSRQKSAMFAPFYSEPVPLEQVEASASFDGVKKEFNADKIQIDLGGGAVATGKISGRTDEAGTLHVEAAASLKNLPVDKIKVYWPQALTPVPRKWVTGHLSGGTATLATLDLGLERLADGSVKLGKLGGKIDFNGIKVDYFPPLEPVHDVRGTATYDRDKFALALDGGRLVDMSVRSSDILISGFGGDENSKINITVDLSGPFKTALDVLDSEPLKYPTDLGLDPKKVGGDAAVKVHFNFPLHQALALHEVAVDADAVLTDALLKDVVEGFDLSGGPYTLKVDNHRLKVSGKGKLGDMAADIDWQKNFSNSADFSSRIGARLDAQPELLAKFGVNGAIFGLKGDTPVDVTYTTMFDGSGSATVIGNLTQAELDVAQLGYRKVAGVPGTVSLIAHVAHGKPDRVSNLKILSGELSAAADIVLAQDGNIKKAVISELKLGERTNVRADIENRPGIGYVATVKGTQFDASAFFKERKDQPPRVFPVVAGTPFSISLDVGRLLTGEGRFLDKIRLFVRKDAWDHTDQLEMDGMAGGKAVYLRYLPVAKGHSLRFEGGNAGATLRALGISNGVQGGTLLVEGRPNPKIGNRDLIGTVSLNDFRLIKVPALAKLLNALSLPGFQELMENKGISFTKMKAKFAWTDKTPPAETKNPVQVLTVEDGQTSGASLGLTFDGTLDDVTGNLDLKGTIVPVSDLNKLISSIPVVGDILAGGTGAVFAATYTVKGPTNEPTVTVNPLAALAPGLLRKMFFEN